jgi:hypothetical protein
MLILIENDAVHGRLIHFPYRRDAAHGGVSFGGGMLFLPLSPLERGYAEAQFW